MREKLEELEQKISALLELVARQSERLSALKDERAELVARLTSAEDLANSQKKENRDLERRLADVSRQGEELGKQLTQGSSMESEMRERIRKIIERIEHVENDLAQEAEDQEDAP